MNTLGKTLFVLVLLAAGGGTGYYFYHTHIEGKMKGEAPKAEPSKKAESDAEYPVPSETELAEDEKGQEAPTPPRTEVKPTSVPVKSKPTPRPVLKEGMGLETALTDLLGEDQITAFFYPDNLVKRLVVTIDSATQHLQLSPEMLAFKPTPGSLLTIKKDHRMLIAPENYNRFKPFLLMVQEVDPKKLVALYVRHYKSFQNAYEELGTKNYFNDRLVQIIDHVLATPDVVGDIGLDRPTWRYKYKYDEDRLETLSYSQKALIRMGPDASKQIKEKLKQIRTLVSRNGLQKKK